MRGRDGNNPLLILIRGRKWMENALRLNRQLLQLNGTQGQILSTVFVLT